VVAVCTQRLLCVFGASAADADGSCLPALPPLCNNRGHCAAAREAPATACHAPPGGTGAGACCCRRKGHDTAWPPGWPAAGLRPGCLGGPAVPAHQIPCPDTHPAAAESVCARACLRSRPRSCVAGSRGQACPVRCCGRPSVLAQPPTGVLHVTLALTPRGRPCCYSHPSPSFPSAAAPRWAAHGWQSLSMGHGSRQPVCLGAWRQAGWCWDAP